MLGNEYKVNFSRVFKERLKEMQGLTLRCGKVPTFYCGLRISFT